MDWARNKCPLSALTGVRIKRVKFRENVRVSPGTKKTVRNDKIYKISVLSGCP